MLPRAVQEGAERGPKLCSKCFGKRRAGDEVGAPFEKEPNQGGIPAKQNVRKRNGREVGRVLQEKLDELQVSRGNGAEKRVILCLLADITACQQHDKAVESALHCDLEWRGFAFGRY